MYANKYITTYTVKMRKEFRKMQREKPGNNSTDISGSKSGMQMLFGVRVGCEYHCVLSYAEMLNRRGK